MLTRMARWTERARRSAFALPMMVAVAVMMLLISELTNLDTRRELAQLTDLTRARAEAFTVLRRLSEAESSQRGYMLTERDNYLAPYQQARREVLDSLRRQRELLRTLGLDTAEPERQHLETLVGNKIGEMDAVLRMIAEGRREGARDLMLSEIGHEQMQAIQKDAEHLIELHNRSIGVVVQDMQRTLQLNRLGIAALTLFTVAVLAVFLRQGRVNDDFRAQKAAELRAERDRLEHEVARRTAELTELARHLQTAREDERARLARDLHDELGALLTAAKLDVARIRPSLQQAAPDLMPRLTHLTETLNSGIALKRRIIEDLRPSTLDNLGLKAALEVLCAESADRLGIPVALHAEGLKLAPGAELTAFRLVQEALNNIAKYAKASQVQVRLTEVDPDTALLEVRDDGQGFDTGLVRPAAHGLMGMRFRVHAEGGTLQVQSAPGQGTTIGARLPLAPWAPKAVATPDDAPADAPAAPAVPVAGA